MQLIAIHPNRQPNLERMDEIIKRKKKAEKAIGNYGYTPLTSRILANVFVDLSIGDKQHANEVMAMLKRIVEGKTK